VDGQSDETFQPTNGRIVGTLGLVVVLALLIVGALEGLPLWGYGLLLSIGVLTWAAVLRPGVRIAGDELVLRNMLDTTGVPLGAIEQVSVRRVLVVQVGEKRFVSPAISRSLRQTMRPKKRDRIRSEFPDEGRDMVALAARSYPDFVEHRIRDAAAAHRERLGIKGWSDEQEALGDQVRIKHARPELAALAVSLLLLVVGIVIAL
jgi:hypothetical protein